MWIDGRRPVEKEPPSWFKARGSGGVHCTAAARHTVTQTPFCRPNPRCQTKHFGLKFDLNSPLVLCDNTRVKTDAQAMEHQQFSQ